MVSYLCGHNTIFGKAWNGPPRIWIVEFFYYRVSLQPVSIEAKMWMYSFLQYMSNYSCNTYEYDMTSLHHKRLIANHMFNNVGNKKTCENITYISKKLLCFEHHTYLLLPWEHLYKINKYNAQIWNRMLKQRLNLDSLS